MFRERSFPSRGNRKVRELGGRVLDPLSIGPKSQETRVGDRSVI